MKNQSKQAETQFAQLAKPYLQHPEVQQMASYIQHGTISTLDHVTRVAYTAFTWANSIGVDVDKQDLVAGALLHDFYLYDWHDRSTSMPHHATMHPIYAAQNAARVFDVNDHVLQIIRSHMWPLPLTRLPQSREAWLVSVADKYCSLYETILCRREKRRKVSYDL